MSLYNFGAHALDDILLDQRIIFNTGNEYHAFHSISLIVLGILNKTFNLDLQRVTVCFVFGILLFSVSLYMISILKVSFFRVFICYRCCIVYHWMDNVIS